MGHLGIVNTNRDTDITHAVKHSYFGVTPMGQVKMLGKTLFVTAATLRTCGISHSLIRMGLLGESGMVIF